MEVVSRETAAVSDDHDESEVEEITSQKFRAPRLDNLPEEVLQRILCYILPVKVTITPWFNCGTSTHGIRGFGLNDEHITFNPNIDADFLRSNRACYELGTNIIYGSNHFHFHKRPDCCKWWLKRIGDHNVRKIRKMTFILNTGWRYDRRNEDLVASPFEQSHEEQWFNALHLIQRSQVKLEYLNLKLKDWVCLQMEADYNEEDKEELERYRKMLVDQLTKFRGVKKVKIEELGGEYIGREVLKLELLMQQPLWTLKPEPRQPELNLKQLIEYCKRQNEIKERRIEEARLTREQSFAMGRRAEEPRLQDSRR